MRVRQWVLSLLLMLGVMAPALQAQTPGPLFRSVNLQVRTDENNYLLVTAVAPTGQPSDLFRFTNIRLRTDENGYLMVACATCGGGGTPGGSDTQVQFNDAGAFGGDSQFTFNKTEGTLNLTPTMTSTAFDAGLDITSTFTPSGAASYHSNLYSYLNVPSGATNNISNSIDAGYFETDFDSTSGSTQNQYGIQVYANRAGGGSITSNLAAGYFITAHSGTGAAANPQGIYNSVTLSGSGNVSGSLYGIRSLTAYNNSAGTAPGQVYGASFSANTNSAVQVSTMYGVYGEAEGVSSGGANNVFGAYLDGSAGKANVYGAYIVGRNSINATGNVVGAYIDGSAASSAAITGTVIGADIYGRNDSNTQNNTIVGVRVTASETGSGTPPNIYGVKVEDVSGGTTNYALHTGAGVVRLGNLTSTGAATGKSVVCVDTTSGILYASSTGTDCSN